MTNKYKEALDALNEADDCYQPETLEDLRGHFPIIREVLTAKCLDIYLSEQSK